VDFLTKNEMWPSELGQPSPTPPRCRCCLISTFQWGSLREQYDRRVGKGGWFSHAWSMWTEPRTSAIKLLSLHILSLQKRQGSLAVTEVDIGTRQSESALASVAF
jgi:hypothetical protein